MSGLAYRLLPQLSNAKIILASGSPRRKEIMLNLGFNYEVVVSSFEENLDKSAYTPITYVLENSKQKALHVMQDMRQNNKHFDDDDVKVYKEHILEKPHTHDKAIEMLTMLSGVKHAVISGVCLLWNNGLENVLDQFYEQTIVEFDSLSPETIKAYVFTDEPLDKAGAYGIQGQGGMLIKGIAGDYFNVVGFPVHAFFKCLKRHYDNVV